MNDNNTYDNDDFLKENVEGKAEGEIIDMASDILREYLIKKGYGKEYVKKLTYNVRISLATIIHSKFLCCSCLAETKTFHLFYACVHSDSFHYVYSQPFLIFSQLYQICGFGTLSGRNLYTYWRITVHFSWLISVHFIILLIPLEQPAYLYIF